MRTKYQPMSFWTRVKFLFGFYNKGKVMETVLHLEDLEKMISGAVKEMEAVMEKHKDNPEVVKFVLYACALQMRIARFNIVEAGYPDIMINSVFKDQP